MRILQIVQKAQLRGAEIFASQLSNHLIEAGHDVKLVTLFPGDAALPFQGEVISLNRPLGNRFFDIHGWRQLCLLIEKFNPDIIQANAGDTLKFVVFSKLIFRWKTPIVFRNANKVSDFINTRPKLLFNKFLMDHVQHVISVSELCRQDFVNTYSYTKAKTTTIPIGINLQQINRTIPPDLSSFFSSSKILVHAASFVREKNHKGLLNIIRRLVDRGEDVKVILIGDGGLRSAIELQVAEMNLNDRVFLAGYRTDVLSIMINAHAFALPSLIEGLPGVVLEAMFCKVPVVAYDVGGVSEIIKPGETGWLVKAGDESGFILALTQALIHPDIELITDNAFQMVVKEFDNLVVAKKFLITYGKLI